MRTTSVLDHDEQSKTTEYYHFDPTDHSFMIETRQDISGLIEMNKAVVNNARGDWKGEFHHVARIPNVILMDLAQQGIVTPAGKVLDEKRYKAWLNDPANSAFRVKGGKV